MIEWIVKKVIVRRINKLLDSKRQGVEVVRSKVGLWLDRVRRVVSCLESLSAKLDDNKLDAAELKEAGAEITATIKAW